MHRLPDEVIVRPTFVNFLSFGYEKWCPAANFAQPNELESQ
jgi:hypothetical protein